MRGSDCKASTVLNSRASSFSENVEWIIELHGAQTGTVAFMRSLPYVLRIFLFRCLDLGMRWCSEVRETVRSQIMHFRFLSMKLIIP